MGLNSLLFTGRVEAVPVTNGDIGRFVLVDEHVVKGSAMGQRETVRLPVFARGDVVFRSAAFLVPGQMVRVVGEVRNARVSVHPGTDKRGHEEPTEELRVWATYVEAIPG